MLLYFNIRQVDTSAQIGKIRPWFLFGGTYLCTPPYSLCSSDHTEFLCAPFAPMLAIFFELGIHSGALNAVYRA